MKEEKWVVSEKEMVVNHEGEWIETKKKLVKKNKKPILENIVKVLSPLAIITPFILLFIQFNKQDQQAKNKAVAQLYKDISLDFQLSYCSPDSSIEGQRSFQRLKDYYLADLTLYTTPKVIALFDTLTKVNTIHTKFYYWRKKLDKVAMAFQLVRARAFTEKSNYYIPMKTFITDSTSILNQMRIINSNQFLSHEFYVLRQDLAILFKGIHDSCYLSNRIYNIKINWGTSLSNLYASVSDWIDCVQKKQDRPLICYDMAKLDNLLYTQREINYQVYLQTLDPNEYVFKKYKEKFDKELLALIK
ncbi:MAG: hypothetical protein QM737_01440 [Ferruginibacter sp.]